MDRTRIPFSEVGSTVRKSLYNVPSPSTGSSLSTVLRAGWHEALPGVGVDRAHCMGDDILFCLSGTGQIETANDRFRLSQGQVGWIAGETPHKHRSDSENPWSLMWFRLQSPEIPALRQRIFGDARLRRSVLDVAEIVAWFNTLFDILEAQDTYLDLKLHAHLSNFFVLLTGQTFPNSASILPPSLDRVVQSISENPKQPWNSDKMAEVANLSQSQIRRLFKTYFGQSPTDYLRSQRLILAQKLMLESRAGLVEIAEQCGFYDAYHFSRTFKKVFNQSPSEWRRAERQTESRKAPLSGKDLPRPIS